MDHVVEDHILQGLLALDKKVMDKKVVDMKVADILLALLDLLDHMDSIMVMAIDRGMDIRHDGHHLQRNVHHLSYMHVSNIVHLIRTDPSML